MTDPVHQQIRGGIWLTARGLALLSVGGMLALVGVMSPAALVVVLRHGAPALLIVGGAAGWGLWLIRPLRLQGMERRWELLLGAGLGLGAASLAMLGAGLVGAMSRPMWLAFLIAGVLVGAIRLPKVPQDSAKPADRQETGRLPALWLAASAFGTLALLAATMPPGTLWRPEAGGYDVLEYHLAAPREYVEAGRIHYLPHNIYSNFPFNVEMLYLLSMVLHGEPVTAALTAQLVNFYLGCLAVGAIWLAGREFGPTSGLVAGLVAASCPFVSYLCGVAYVENGLLFFSALAMAAMLRSTRCEAGHASRWIIASGLCSGLACGCKYTAAPAVIIPLGLTALWLGIRARPAQFRWPIVYSLATAATVGPWLVKNAAWTGNPVFPLAHSVFSGRAGVWDEDGAGRWHEGHSPAPEDRTLAARAGRLGREVIFSKMFGPAIGLALLVGIVQLASRTRAAPPSPPMPSPLPCWMMLLIGIVAWTGFTHLVDRFAVGLLVPAAVILGQCAESIRARTLKVGGVGVLGIMIVVNLAAAVGLFSDNGVFQICAMRHRDGLEWFTEGQMPWYQHVPRLNTLAKSGRRILMVGDARRFYLRSGVDYCVVFNRNPFAEAAARCSPAELIEWLLRQGYGYVYVDWTEVHRLRRSRYGFWPSIDEGLFDRLTAAGLRRVEQFAIEEGRPPYGVLYEVPRG